MTPYELLAVGVVGTIAIGLAYLRGRIDEATFHAGHTVEYDDGPTHK